MEVGLLKTLAQVAGIGGISLGVLLILLRDIIRKNIFPKFKDEVLAYRLLRLVVITVWTVAIFGTATWAVTAIFGPRGSETFAVSHTEQSFPHCFHNRGVISNQAVGML